MGALRAPFFWHDGPSKLVNRYMAANPDTGSGTRSWTLSDIGQVRAENQDCTRTDDARGLWLLADGMGGHAGGRQASVLACRVVDEEIARGRDLARAMARAHEAIRDAQRHLPEIGDMGTTLVGVHEQDRSYHLCWVGDSRAYRFDRASGTLSQLTRDHTVAELLAASGELDADQVATHPQRHILTSCLGQRGEAPVIEERQENWGVGDWLLLCSDGLSGELSPERIGEVLGRHDDPEAATRELVDSALDAGGRDNISLVIIKAPQP